MAKNGKSIHFLKATLDEIAGEKGSTQIVLRGVLDPVSLADLKVDEYQREPLPLSALSKLWGALRDGESLPDIELGMRGQDFDVSKDDKEFWLKGDVYIIDGQQRRNAALHILSIMPELNVRMGAMVHFGTSRTWERERFRVLNLDRSRVSPNVLLRNMRHQSLAVLTLYGLSYNEPKFALVERVCWKQAVSKEELVSARTLCAVVGILHAHRSPAFRTVIGELVPALDRQAGFVRMEKWRKNIIYFFDFVDEAWGLRKVAYRDLCLQTRTGFLLQLARVISDHSNFWEENQTSLNIDTEWTKRFASFPLHDPTVVQLLSSGAGGHGGGATSMIYTLLKDHLNKGRSAHRLRNREDEAEALRPKRFPSEPRREEDGFEGVEYPT